jgi:PAS domain S-box-containing protein
MAFWFNKKEDGTKPDGTPGSQPGGEEAPLLKPLGKTGAIPAGKPAGAPAPAPAPAAPAPAAAAPAATNHDGGGLKVRPKVDQRALYQQLMNGLYDAVFILDERGNVMESNSRVSEVLGYTRDEAWDLPIATIIPGMTRQLMEHLKKNLVESNHVLIDSRCFRKDGTSFAGEIGVSNINFMRGNNMIFTIRNVDRRKAALVDAKRFQAAVEHSLVPMFICNTDGTFIMANPFALQMFDIRNLADKKTAKILDYIPGAAAAFEEAAKGGQNEGTYSLTFQGQTVNFKMALAGIKNGEEIIGVSASVMSI